MRRKLVESRTEAQRAIKAGLVRVASHTDAKASTLVAPDDPVHLVSRPEPFVSRGGRKLAAAFEAFDIELEGMRAIDVGASTGGFTDCMLQRGVRSVTALDVGYGQLHWRIRNDARVTVVERANIRTADPAELGAPFDMIVADLSFISLRTVSEQLVALGSEEARWILLIKPQFEAGRNRVPRGGVIKDVSVRLDVLAQVVATYTAAEIGCVGLIESPITGATGNVEYLATFLRGRGTVTSNTIKAALDRTLQ